MGFLDTVIVAYESRKNIKAIKKYEDVFCSLRELSEDKLLD